MPGISPTDAMQARWRASADKKAFDAVTRHSQLRGEPAANVARRAVSAAEPDLRTMHVQKMAGISAREATVVGLALTATLGLQVAALVALFRQAGPKTKVLAASGVATNVGLFAYARLRQHRIRQFARAELAPAKSKAASA